MGLGGGGGGSVGHCLKKFVSVFYVFVFTVQSHNIFRTWDFCRPLSPPIIFWGKNTGHSITFEMFT